MDLLSQFADPQIMKTLSMSDKLTAGLITTMLGMGITFTALVVLQFIIPFMDKLLNKKEAQSPKTTITQHVAPSTPSPDKTDDTELIAVITSVLAMKLKTSTENIVIRNIEKISDHSPAWNRAGIIEQMNNRL